MGTDAADPENRITWHLARRRRMFRDLLLTAAGIGLLVLAGVWTGWNVEPVITVLAVLLVGGTLYNFRLYRAEKRVAERLADGVTTAWRPLSVVTDGRAVPTSWPGSWGLSYLLVSGDRYEMLVGGRTVAAGTARLVADGEVRQTDVTPDVGPHAGRTLAQISRTDGDVLVACAAEPDQPRPTAFTSEPGSGHTLSVWLRVR